MILVTGATGSIGAEVVRLLAERGASARAFHRRPADSARFEDLGLGSAIGGFDDPDAIVAAMQGCDRVFLLPPATAQQERLEENALEAAQRAGVRRVVKVSAADANPTSPVPWAKSHAIGEEKLRRSGLGYTILRPSAFFQNLLALDRPIKRGFLPMAAGSGRASMIDARDVAAVAAIMLTQDGHDRATYFLTGPEDLSMRDVAARLSTATGRRIRYLDLPRPLYRLSLRAAGVDKWLAEGLVEQYANVFAGGHDIARTDEVERLTGQPPRPFDSFAREYRQAFGP